MQKPSIDDLEKAYAKLAEQLKKRAGELRANSQTQNKHTRRGYAAGPVQEPGALIPISDAELLTSFEQEQYNRLKNETQATLFEKLSTLLSGNSVGEGFKDILSDSVSHLP